MKEEMQNLCGLNGRTEQYCGEHRRRLELFCQEDEAFICVLCVPRHSSHNFQFLHEAVSVYKDKLKATLSSLEIKLEHLKDLQNKNEKDLLDVHEDASSLEQYITQEFTKLHLFLHDSEQKLLQQLKSKEATVLKGMEVNLECTKNDATVTHVTVSDADLEFRKEVMHTLEEVEENAEYLKNNVMLTRVALLYGSSEPGEQKTIGFLTVPETFEDVAVTFSEEEWKNLRKQDKELHREVMEQNYETMISVGFKIPTEQLSTLFKTHYEELRKDDVEGKSATEQKDNINNKLKRIRSKPCSVGCSQLSLLGQPHLQHSTENLQQCSEPVKSYYIIRLAPVLQHHSEQKYNKISECDGEVPPLHHPTENLQHCVPPVQGSDNLHHNPAPHHHSGYNCSRRTGCKNETFPLHHPSDYMQQYVQTVNDSDKLPLSPTLQLHSGLNCSHSFECDNETPQFHHGAEKLQQCVQLVNYSKVHLLPPPQVHSQHNCWRIPECNSETAPICQPTKNVQKCSQHVMDVDKVQPPVVPHHNLGHNWDKMSDSNSGFSVQQSAVINQRSHMGEKPYKCPECNKCFTRKQNLRIHQQIHIGSKPYQCAECSKCFTQKQNLRTHQKTHTGERPYKCDECSKCFIQKEQLRIHQRVHTGEKPFKCNECSKCFTQKEHLKIHRRIHTGEKPYKCTECSKQFNWHGQLVHHQIIHTG